MGFRNKDPVSVHVAREHDEYVDFVMHHLIGDRFVAHTGNVKPMITELFQLRRCAVRLWHIGIGINLRHYDRENAAWAVRPYRPDGKESLNCNNLCEDADLDPCRSLKSGRSPLCFVVVAECALRGLSFRLTRIIAVQQTLEPRPVRI